MNWKRAMRAAAWTIGGAILLAALLVGSGWWYLHPTIQRTNGVVYGQRGAEKLGFDILRPSSPNGLGVLLLVSGGWKSSKPGGFGEWLAAPLIRRGYTVFPVYHVSQPRATIGEITADMHRAVRFIRHHAVEYGIDPKHLGVTGGSAGGHLGLMLATRGGPGTSDAADPIERESSAVQAVAIFYPVTDLLNLGKSTENLGDGGPPKSFVKGFGPQATNLAVWRVIGRELSPLHHITSNLPPVLIHHGDADTLTPLEQSEWFRDAALKLGRDVTLRVHQGGKHGWLTMPWDIRQFGVWFDEKLRR
jgi:acetyl esterase/lipase